MMLTSQTPVLGSMEMFVCQNVLALLPIIQSHVHPVTIIHSDGAAYEQVQQLPSFALHETINHSESFINLATGTHTQNIESYWNWVKTKFKRMRVVHEEMLSSYLDKFMWCQQHSQITSTALP